MTSFSKLYKLDRQMVFPAMTTPADSIDLARAIELPTLGPRPTEPTDLLVPGQGTIVFKHARRLADDTALPLHFTLGTAANPKIVEFSIASTHISLVIAGQAVAVQANPPLTTTADDYIFYWLSLETSDSQYSELRFGVGEARVETLRFTHKLTHEQRVACQQITTVYPHPNPATLVDVMLMRLLRDPVVTTVPLAVRGAAELTMDDIAQNRYLPAAALPEAAKQLYDTIAGPQFVLNTAEFPDFTRAIKHSIETPGGWCHTKLTKKRRENSPDQQNRVYLRITLGHNGGESPGIPFVLEIWPPQCYSSVHQHAGANAVIRVLHGSIQVSLFPYLRPTGPGAEVPDEEVVFGTHIFEEGAITWVSPVLNQTHRLRNLEPLGGQPCLTIQCYRYDADDIGHYPYFDYDKADGGLHQFEPDSDMDFNDFKAQMREEWQGVNK